MIDLRAQIITFLFSFSYGVVISYIFSIVRAFLYNAKTMYKVINCILFTSDIVLIYQIIIYRINQGYFHLYFIFVFILGLLISNKYFIYKKNVKR